MADEITQDEFLAAFNTTPEGTDDNDEDLNTASGNVQDGDESEGTDKPEGEVEGEGEGEGDTNNDPDPDPADSAEAKKAYAFAQMRTENKQNRELLQSIAKVLGVRDTSNPEELTQALQDKVIAAQAKRDNIPEDFLRRVSTLEKDNQAFVQEQVKRTAFLGFQKVKDTFGLENKDISKFADELVAEGMNPFETPMDLLKEYKTRNFEKLLADAEAKGAAAEAARANKAEQHGSSPDNKQGKRNTGDEKINTMKELSNFLSNN